MSKTVDLGPVSAYALAVKHGYEGTEEQWIAEVESKRVDAVNAAADARKSADTATEKAEIATQKAEEITGKSAAAAASATKAQSYAVGGTGSRDGEDTDNAQYYYEQVKRVSQGLNGIIPMGTVAFADLPVSGMENGWMYNISDDFTSDDRFNDGGGIFYGKGNNVIWTSEGKWDVTAGSGVTGIKGNKEKTYRQGNVNLTPEQIGAVAEDGDTSDTTVAFASSDTPDVDASAWESVAKLTSGEKNTSLFAKISQMFKNVRYLYKMLGSTDISSIGGGTVTGAISALNTDLGNLNKVTWIVNAGNKNNTANLSDFKSSNYVVHVLIYGYQDSTQYRFYHRFQIGSSLSTDETYYLPLPSFTYDGNKSFYAVMKMSNWAMSLHSLILNNIDKTNDAAVYIGLSVA